MRFSIQYFPSLMMLCLALLNVACDRHWKATKINGVVVEKSTGNPVNNATVAVYAWNNGNMSDEEFAESNQAGKFEMKFKSNRKKTYYIRATHSEYFVPGETTYPLSDNPPRTHTSLTLKKKNDPMLELHSKSTLRVLFKPLGKLDTNRKLRVDMPYYDIRIDSSVWTQQPKQGEYIYGPNVVIGNSNNEVRWTITVNGDSTSFSKSMYCSQNSLNEMLIEY